MAIQVTDEMSTFEIIREITGLVEQLQKTVIGIAGQERVLSNGMKISAWSGGILTIPSCYQDNTEFSKNVYPLIRFHVGIYGMSVARFKPRNILDGVKFFQEDYPPYFPETKCLHAAVVGVLVLAETEILQ